MKKRLGVQLIALAVAVAFVVIGVVRGENRAVRNQAETICTECVGLQPKAKPQPTQPPLQLPLPAGPMQLMGFPSGDAP